MDNIIKNDVDFFLFESFINEENSDEGKFIVWSIVIFILN